MAPQLRDHRRYDIVAEHGRGGLGRVSRARDRELGRDIAIKELISRGQLGEVRFFREALITARLEHPGIVPVYEAGRWADGTPFYAMKLVAGRSLRDLIAERTTVDDRIALLHHVIAVADAIAYAHGRNIIHRDLKPANVIVGEFGETVVIDWGLAKDLTAAEESTVIGGPFRTSRDDALTSAGAVLGTPAYMAPEQERGEPVDQRADVFAIGAMLWELCSVRRVPPGDPGQRRRVLRRARIDPDLAAIIEKATDPDRDRRYADAGALAADLKAFKTGARIAARRYSLWALLAHWTRRHRALAIASAVVTALAIGGVALYLHRVSTERNRADAALDAAQRELDRAQLAEASLLLDKDPTRAAALLDALTRRTPQHALLQSRARGGAAERVLHLPGMITRLVRHPTNGEVAIFTIDGVLESLDVATGRRRLIDTGLLGPATSDGDGWLYARRRFGASSVTVLSSGEPARSIDTGGVLADHTDRLVAAGPRVYGLHGHDLYALDGAAPARVQRDVRSVAGGDHLLLVCTMNRELEIRRDGALERRARCADSGGAQPMAVAGSHYAALLDPDHLLVGRGGEPLELPIHVSGVHELAIAPSGLVALADQSDKTWFVRPGGDHLELGPVHASLPISVAAEGSVAAWGYADGAVIAIDTRTGQTWEFRGHPGRVMSVAIDPERRRLVSASGPELRIWRLAPSPLAEVPGVPTTIYRVAPSPDGAQIALDGFDGVVRTWRPASGEIAEVHRHSSTAHGVAWWRDQLCSGGFDGRVLCTAPDGATRTILDVRAQIRWLAPTPDRGGLAIATADGKLSYFDGALRTLYAHGAPPYRMAFSADGRTLASGADDGSVMIYDLAAGRVTTAMTAHTARVLSVAWRGDQLWTSGADGAMLHWRFVGQVPILVDSVLDSGAFRFLHLLADGWIGNIESRWLVIERGDPRAQFRLDLGHDVSRLEISPDERYLAAAIAGEVVVVDLARRAIATLPIPSDGIGFVGFTGPDQLAVSTATRLLAMPASDLAYVAL